VRLGAHEGLQRAVRKRIRDRERRHARIVGSTADTSDVRRAPILVALITLAGCGSHPDIQVTNRPPECVGDSAGLVKALAKAPGRVLVDGQPISSCFKRDQGGAELQVLGTGLLAAAQQLGDRAATDADSALRLGYLIGAARRGLQRNGVAAEMIRRLEGETTHLGANVAAYRRGLRAGLAQG
jgi:hypothetical protein